MTADERDQVLDGQQFDDENDVENAWEDETEVAEDDIDEVMDAAAAGGEDPAGQLRELVVWLVDQLMDEPEHVTVETIERGSVIQVQVRLPEEDLGKIIGRGGRIAKAMRTALMIAGSRHNVRVSLDIEGRD